MSKVIVDSVLRQRLQELMQPVELCDESGKVLGRFVPDQSDFEPREPQVSEAELARREASSERRYSTAEVLAHLERR